MPDELPHLPLFVDLDGTLLQGDTLPESLAALARQRPWLLFAVPWWLTQGRRHLKSRLADHARLSIDVLPYRAELLAFLAEARQLGRPVILATGSHCKVAEAIAAHLGLFDAVLASDERVNLKGEHKLRAIQAMCREQGWEGFEYIGDSTADLPIMRSATGRYTAGSSAALVRRLGSNYPPQQHFARESSLLWAVLKSIRAHQWAKNLIVLVPLLVAHVWMMPDKVAAALVAFVVFCLVASGVYLINDLLDLDADRRHATKRRRPLAAGHLSPIAGLLLSICLTGLGGGLAVALLPRSFLLVLAVYVALTLAYSLWLKRQPVTDTLVLAGLYTIRLIAGCAAIGVVTSEWLLMFSIFIFMSLAFAKRYSELYDLGDEQTLVRGRGYYPSDRNMVLQAGCSCGYLAVLVFAMYVSSDYVAQIYSNPQALWLLCPLLLYWITRFWFIVHRGQMHDDPIVFALCDPTTYIVAFASIAIIFYSSLSTFGYMP